MLVLRASCPVSSLPRSQTVPGPQDTEEEEEEKEEEEEEEEEAEAKDLRNGPSKTRQGLHSESRFL